MDSIIQIGFAIAGGILPAFFWLYFWLQEDELHPEPNRLIIITFISGMISVPVALAFQVIINKFVVHNADVETLFFTNYILALIILAMWAAIEEVAKYLAAYLGGLSKKDNNEPIDPIIYMITAALGFSALENTLFLINPIFQGETTTALITGNMRFIGATLLHIASAAVIGIFIAFSYYKNNYFKKRYLLTGFILSVILHTLFNSFIIRSGVFTLLSFAIVWVVIIAIIIIFEKVKIKINNR